MPAVSLISGPPQAALSDAYANPTASAIYSLGGVWNGTTWDRLKSAPAAQATSGAGIAASAAMGFDGTSYRALSVDVNGRLPLSNFGSWAAADGGGAASSSIPATTYGMAYNGTTWDRLRTDGGGSLNIKLKDGMGLGSTAFTADAANPIGMAAGTALYNGTTWDRGRAMTSLTGSNGTVGVQAVMPMMTDGSGTYALRISLGDGTNNALNVGGFVYNGTNWDRARSATSANATTGTGLPGVAVMGWDGTNYQRIGTGANVTDGTNNQGLGVVNLTYNGVNWDRVRSANIVGNTTGTGLVGVGPLGYDGTNWQRLGAVVGDTGQNMLVTTGSRKEVSFTTTTAQAVATTDVSNYRWVSVYITTQGTGSTVNFQGSNDNVNWTGIALTFASSGNTTSTSSAGLLHGPVAFRYFRLNVVGISAGTTAGVIEFFSMPAAMQASAVSATLSPITPLASDAAASTYGTMSLQVFNGTTWDRLRSAPGATGANPPGVLAAGLMAWDYIGNVYRIAGVGSGDAFASTAILGATTYLYNGTNVDRARSAPGAPTGTLATAPMASSTGGATPFKLIAAANTNATSIKASAGTVYSLTITNVNAAVRYVKLYDKATAPTVGTDVPVHTYAIPANASHAVTITLPTGMAFAAGIALAITAAAADSDTTAVTAGDVILNIDYK